MTTRICAGVLESPVGWGCKIHQLYLFRGVGLGVGGAYGVMVIVIGNGHGDTSSNLGRD